MFIRGPRQCVQGSTPQWHRRLLPVRSLKEYPLRRTGVTEPDYPLPAD